MCGQAGIPPPVLPTRRKSFTVINRRVTCLQHGPGLALFYVLRPRLVLCVVLVAVVVVVVNVLPPPAHPRKVAVLLNSPIVVFQCDML